jgi:hypothetical protein
MTDEYTCVMCGGTFSSTASEADSLMEFQESFSEEERARDTSPPVVVCDDCYEVLKANEERLTGKRRH